MAVSTTPARGGSGAMFDRIAHRYDLLNRLMSFGIDRRWRRRAVRSLQAGSGARLLDLATGTADLALEAVHQLGGEIRVDALDPSERMIEIGREKSSGKPIAFHVGDAQDLPFSDGCFDGAMMAFGIRNVPDRERALREMRRVLRPGGRVAILELSEPRRGLIGPLARLYVHHIVPLLGALLSGAWEYRYLQKSIAAFPEPEEFNEMLTAAGFSEVDSQALTFGTCQLFTGTFVGDES